MISKLNNTAADQFVEVMSGSLNLDNCIRHLALTMVISHFDSYTGSGRNYYLYEDRSSGRFHILPWDMDQSFGVYTYNWNVVSADIVSPSNLSQRPLNRRLLENDSLRNVYFSYLRDMIGSAASPDSVAAKTSRLLEVIGPHVERDPNKFFSYQQFLTGINNNVVVNAGPRRTVYPGLTSLMEARRQSVLSQIEGQSSVVPGRISHRADIVSVNTMHRGAGTVVISYRVEHESAPVRIELLDLRGALIASYDEGRRDRGVHSREIVHGAAAAGLRLVRVVVGRESGVVRVIGMK